MKKSKALQKSMAGSVIAIFVLAICLTVTTFALVYATVSVEENVFRTGRVQINLNDGAPIIREDEFLFEPGMTVVKPFFIENLSTWDVYYKLYFGNVSGGLADVLQITISDGTDVVCSGTMSELSRERVVALQDPLSVLEKKEFTVTFYFPPEAGNETQATDLRFDLCADATQTKNNPSRAFD